MKNNLYFRLQDDRRLRKAYRKAIVKTDNEFNRLDVEIPRIIDEVDVSDFDYTVKFEVNDKYLEKTPDIRVEQDRLVLSVVVTDLITPVKGRIKFSITGQKEDTKFSSAIGTIEIKDTLHIGDYIEPDMLKVWLDEIKDNIKKFKGDLDGELKQVDKTLNEKIEKEIGEALKELESLKLKKIIVDELPPIEQAEDYAIYFVPKDKDKDNNIYEEYLFVDGVFEKIGDTNDIDLTGYIKETDLETVLQKYLKEDEIKALIGQVESEFANYLPVDKVKELINNVDIKFNDYVTIKMLEEELSGQDKFEEIKKEDIDLLF